MKIATHPHLFTLFPFDTHRFIDYDYDDDVDVDDNDGDCLDYKSGP